jgi:hypothetical protein
VVAKLGSIFLECSVKHEAKVIMDLNIDKSQGVGGLVLRHLPLIHESGRDVTPTTRHKVFSPSLGLGIISFLFSKHSLRLSVVSLLFSCRGFQEYKLPMEWTEKFYGVPLLQGFVITNPS